MSAKDILGDVKTTSTLHSIQQSTASVLSDTNQHVRTNEFNTNAITRNRQAANETIQPHLDSQTLMPQHVSNEKSEIFLHLPLQAGVNDSSPKFMILNSASDLLPSSEVLSEHSYSFTNPVVSLSSSCNGQEFSTTSGQQLQFTELTNNILIMPPPVQLKTGIEKLGSVKSIERDSSSTITCVTDIMAQFSLINKLSSGLISFNRNISSLPSSPQLTLDSNTKYTNPDIDKREKIRDHLKKSMSLLKFNYYNQVLEHVLLMSGYDIMERLRWKKSVPPEILGFLQTKRLLLDDDLQIITDCLARWFQVSSTTSG